MTKKRKSSRLKKQRLLQCERMQMRGQIISKWPDSDDYSSILFLYTPVDEKSIRLPIQGILQGDFRGCRRLFRVDFGRILEENKRNKRGKTRGNYLEKIPKILEHPIK